MVGKTLQQDESKKFTENTQQQLVRDTNQALKSGDMETARKNLDFYQTNKPAFEKVGYTENRFLKESTQGINDQQLLTQFFRIALETGFSTQSILSASLATDKGNDTQVTASLAASNAQYAQALLALLDEYIKQETDKKIKENLLDKKEVLTGMGIGKKEVDDESSAFKKFVKNVDDILKDKTEIKLLSALYLHSNLKTPIANAFANRTPIEES